MHKPNFPVESVDGRLKVSLAIIARDDAPGLRRLLEGIYKHIDQLVVVVDSRSDKETLDVAEEFAAKVSVDSVVDLFEWPKLDFSIARNRSFDLCTNDVIMWLDTDDTVKNPDRLMAEIRKLFASDVDLAMVRYDYEFDKNGNCTTRLWRERVVRRGHFRWADPIHECLVANYGFRLCRIPVEVGSVEHTRMREDTSRSKVSLERNYAHFQDMLKGGNSIGVRMKFYLGNTLIGLEKFEEALAWLDEYCEESGSQQEIYTARCNQSEVCRILGRFHDGLEYATKAWLLEPNLPVAYVQMAECSLRLYDYNKAASFAKEALDHQKNHELELVYNPKSVMGRPHCVLANCLAHAGQYDQALEHAHKAHAVFPEEESVVQIINGLNNAMFRGNLHRSWETISRQLDIEGYSYRIPELARLMPETLHHHPEVQKHLPRHRDKSRPTIAIYCGKCSEAWDYQSLGSGIGGSEEAVIYMSKELAELGWNVEVYCQTTSPGVQVHDGVSWYPFWAWKGETDDIDVVIVWRSPSLPIVAGLGAKITYCWLHDMPVRHLWPSNYRDMYDGIFVLSEFHRKAYDFLDEDKIFYTRNGIDESMLIPLDDLKNDPKRLLYGSCPSRGLETILDFWPRIREEVPKAELNVYYGWNPSAMNAIGNTPSFANIFNRVERKKHQDGVIWHGRVSQHDMNKAYSECGIWAYPTEFPEISCITAMKCQAHGCWPVTTNFGALPETVFAGTLIDQSEGDWKEKWLKSLIFRMKNGIEPGPRIAMADKARKLFLWRDVAKQWDEKIREDLEECSGKIRSISRGFQEVRWLDSSIVTSRLTRPRMPEPPVRSIVK